MGTAWLLGTLWGLLVFNSTSLMHLVKWIEGLEWGVFTDMKLGLGPKSLQEKDQLQLFEQNYLLWCHN